MAFAGLSTVIVYKKEKCIVKSGKDTMSSTTGAPSQLRAKSIVITYAE